jgi:alpha-mannosidase
VQTHAQHLNHAPVRFEGFAWGETEVPLSVASDTVRVEALKKAEKEESQVIRLVERGGRHCKATLTPRCGAGELIETNLLEWTDEESIPFDVPVELDFNPFQIRTFKLKLNS